MVSFEFSIISRSGKPGKIEKESIDISEEPDLDTSALASELAGTEVRYTLIALVT